MSLTRSRTVWEEGRAPGLEMVALGAALTLTVAVVDLLLSARLGLTFDVAFVLICLGLALAVHLHDSFTVGVLPPLLMLGVCTLFAVSERDAVARVDDTVLQATVSGLSHHSAALALGYAGALGVLWVRHRVQRTRSELSR